MYNINLCIIYTVDSVSIPFPNVRLLQRHQGFRDGTAATCHAEANTFLAQRWSRWWLSMPWENQGKSKTGWWLGHPSEKYERQLG